ncbi:hypothetical protein HanIR_Chr05g0219951 [Helianthus annuus]|nr:hypothetical protein HanIR_Chr05g0219951 [Helianthus annuus]
MIDFKVDGVCLINLIFFLLYIKWQFSFISQHKYHHYEILLTMLSLIKIAITLVSTSCKSYTISCLHLVIL